jgi:hypothetical protein
MLFEFGLVKTLGEGFDAVAPRVALIENRGWAVEMTIFCGGLENEQLQRRWDFGVKKVDGIGGSNGFGILPLRQARGQDDSEDKMAEAVRISKRKIVG